MCSHPSGGVGVELRLDRLNGQRRAVHGDVLRVLDRHGEQVRARHGSRHEAQPLRFRRADRPPGKQQVRRVREADKPGEQPRNPVLGRRAAPGERAADPRLVGGEPDIAAQRLHEADPGAPPVDRRHRDLPHRPQMRRRPRACGDPGTRAELREGLHVHPRTEAVPGAGEDDGADAVIGVRAIGEVEQLLLDLERPRVVPLGTVDGQHGDLPAALETDARRVVSGPAARP